MPSNELITSSEAAAIKTTYILYYRQGNNPYPQFLAFDHVSKNMQTVVDRVKRHCEIMNLRFINVRPFWVNLDEAESRALGTSQQGVTAG